MSEPIPLQQLVERINAYFKDAPNRSYGKVPYNLSEEDWHTLCSPSGAGTKPPADFNINNNVWVKLLPPGYAELERRHHALWKGTKRENEPYIPPPADAQGWTRFQLWNLMEELGHMCHLGDAVPFETGIRLEAPSPEPGACQCIPMAPRPWKFCQDCGGKIPTENNCPLCKAHNLPSCECPADDPEESKKVQPKFYRLQHKFDAGKFSDFDTNMWNLLIPGASLTKTGDAS